MKVVLLVALLDLIGITAWGQAIFRIDSLPQHGVVLDKAWKWKLDDNPEWAKPEFDDTRWDTLNPTQNMSALRKLPCQGIGWLRIHLQTPSPLQGNLIRMYLVQAGASEVFQDGKLILQNGKISPQKRVGEGAIPQYFPVGFMSPDSLHTLAIRFAFSRTQLTNYPYPFLKIQLLKPEIVEPRLKFLKKTVTSQTILFGVFFIMGVLQLLLYVTYRPQKSSLYFGIFLVAQCLTHFSIITSRDPYSFPIPLPVSNFFVFSDVTGIMLISGVVFSALFYLIGIYHYFKKAKEKLFFVTAVLTLTALPLYFLAPSSNIFISYIVAQCGLGCIVPWVEILRVSILAINQKKQGATVFAVAHSILLAAFITIHIVPALFPGFVLPIDGHILFLLAFLSLALTITLLLSQERANTNKLLQKQLSELAFLSKKTIEQEQEKQQMLATQNEQLEYQVELRTAELKSSQAQLIQKEKLASLGELTAGIAHEIQNPLNFVNNFSEVSTELLEELKEEVQAGHTEDVLAIADDLTSNLQKIHHHGGRASSIVKGMLEHSRTESGEKRLTNLNALVDEYLKIAYHGLKAKDKTFACELVTDFDPTLESVEVAPQEIGRVLLNLYNNAFYAVGQRAKQSRDADYKPRVAVRTTQERQQVIIQIRDNGPGIADSIKAKIFQPFFTTKPTGEGTGLGLSLSYDIITKGHGGTLTVESQLDRGTTFSINLPKA